MMEKQHEHFLSVIREGSGRELALTTDERPLRGRSVDSVYHSGSWNLHKDGLRRKLFAREQLPMLRHTPITPLFQHRSQRFQS